MNLTTIARPYAKAILALAPDAAARANWSRMLAALSMIVQNEQVHKLLEDLAIDPSTKADFLMDCADSFLDQQGQNLLRVLAQSKRLLIMPELYNLYEQLRKELEKELSLELITAQTIQAAEQEQLLQLFATQWNGSINMHYAVDPALIGGGRLKIGDRVVDSSIQDRLKTFYNHLTKQ